MVIPCNDLCEAEQREAELPPLDTTKDNYDKGSGSSSRCPRAGAIILETWKGLRTQVGTSCNTWRCISCRNRNMARFKATVVSGCLTLGRCSFITITYKTDSPRLQDAGCVARDWAAFWRRLKKSDPSLKLQWLRIMEVTKKGTPHFHVLVGTVPPNLAIRCWGRYGFSAQRYKARMPTCSCLSHKMGRAWSGVTKGESWIVFGVPVYSGAGAASYLAKYISKDLGGTRYGALGMGRRFSKSNGWPSEKRRRLKPGRDGWKRSLWTNGSPPSDLELKWDQLPKTGTQRQIVEESRQMAKRYLKIGGLDGNTLN